MTTPRRQQSPVAMAELEPPPEVLSPPMEVPEAQFPAPVERFGAWALESNAEMRAGLALAGLALGNPMSLLFIGDEIAHEIVEQEFNPHEPTQPTRQAPPQRFAAWEQAFGVSADEPPMGGMMYPEQPGGQFPPYLMN